MLKRRIKIILFLLVLLFISTLAFADYHITRGPEIGEIYFIGPTATGEGIYHSTDFGETAACMDSISAVESICADKTPGILYYDYYDNLFISYNCGQYGSWIFRDTGSIYINSGVTEGFIYCDISKHSENYGLNFISHNCTGFVGNGTTTEIDNQNRVGYVTVHITGINDSLYLFITHDNYDSLEVQHVFNFDAATTMLSRGFNSGELFFLINYSSNNMGQQLFYSDDYGNTWEQKNTFNCPNLPIRSIVGGRQPGELYMIVEYTQLMYEIAHIYIYHSLDYGETFTVYHPFSHGPEPYVANFEASPINGTAPLTVQFTDLSTGENIYYWEWDFDNDGEIDSYEQNPEYTYQDTGYYSVELSLTPDQLYTATRYNYIRVNDPNAIDEEGEKDKLLLHNSPNPFCSSTTISYSLQSNIREATIEIYNIKGQLIDKLSVDKNQPSVEWNAVGLSSGIYFCKFTYGKTDTIKKLVLIK